MALTNQPYLPLYVMDWLTNNKLKMCSPQAHGIMINIMAIMHKEKTYGKLLLMQKFKQSKDFALAKSEFLPQQNSEQILNFAKQLAKLTSFDSDEINAPLVELIEEGVLILENDFLVCPRMVKDANLSEIRASAGKKGADKNFATAKAKNLPQQNDDFAITNQLTNTQANTENESESESESENENKTYLKNKKSEKKVFKIPTVEEIDEYKNEINGLVTGSEFFNHYESQGWKVGKNNMVDWKACYRGWKREPKAQDKKTGFDRN